MSWDLFVQDLPLGIESIDEIPDDFVPKLIGPRAMVIAGILDAVPDADFSEPTWGRIDGPDYSIEVNIGPDDPVQSFAFHVHGGDLAPGIVSDILGRLQLRALDPESETSIFDPATAVDSLRRWQAYRDRAVGRSRA